MKDKVAPLEVSPTEFSPTDYFSPEHRWDAIAEILATIAVRIVKQRHDHSQSND